MKMENTEIIIQCPHCRGALPVEESYCGRKAQCPYCGKKFIIDRKLLNTESHDALDDSAAGELVVDERSWRCVPMSNHINESNSFILHFDIFKAALNIFLFRIKKMTLGCASCGHTDVYFVPRKSGMYICSCGVINSVEEGVAAYKRRIAGLNNELRITERYIEFHNEASRFDIEWNFVHDARTPRRISRLRELTTRLYQRLSDCNSQKIINATKHASASNVAWCNTLSETGIDGIIGSIVQGAAVGDVFRLSSEERILNSDAGEIQNTIQMYEGTIDKYEDLVDEFSELSYDEARTNRIQSIFGIADETGLPKIKKLRSPDDIKLDIAYASRVNEYIVMRFKIIGIVLFVAFCIALVSFLRFLQ